MVHQQVHGLLALGLEGMERAKRLFVWRLVAHCAALICALAAAVFVEQHHTPGDAYEIYELMAAALAIAFELWALFLNHRASGLHCRGREVMRRVMLLDALDPAEAEAALKRSETYFGPTLSQRARLFKEQDEQLPPDQQRLFNYYYSTKKLGQKRLRDHLFESAIFSHHLYAFAWKFSLACLVVMLVAAGAVVMVLALGHHATPFRLLIALIAFVPASQEVDHLLLYHTVEHQLSLLLKRVERLYSDALTGAEPQVQLLADWGDYCAATTFAPPIRTWVYKRLVKKLVQDFEAKMQQLEKSAAVSGSE
jgi:hypothetical protein